jgi:outer membrane protein assembly complex protein YaeT
MLSNVVRRGLLATAIVLTVAVVLLGLAHVPFVRARVLEWARTRVSTDLGIALDAGALRYNLLSRSLEINGLSLSSPGQPPFLQADVARLVLSPRVFWGTIELQHLEVVRPRLAIVRHRDGTTNLPTASSPSSPETSTPLSLGTIELRQASITIDDETGGGVSLGPIDLALDASTVSPRPGAFGPSAFTVRLAASDAATPPTVVSGTLAGRLGFDGRQLTIPELLVETPEGRLALDGSIDLESEQPGVEAEGQLDVDLARGQRLAGFTDVAIRGSLTTRFEITGSLADPVVRIGMAANDLGYRSVTGAVLDADARYGAGQLAIERFDITSRIGEAHINGTLALGEAADAPDSSRIVARLSSVRLDSMMELADVALPIPLGASTSVDLTAAWDRIDPDGTWLERMSADTAVRFIPEGSGLSLGGEIKGQLRTGQWTIDHAVESIPSRTALAGVATGELRQGTDQPIDSTISLRSRLRAEDLGNAASLVRQAGVELPSLFDEGVSGSAEAWLESSGTMRTPTLLATITARDVAIAKLPAGDLTSTIAVDREVIRADSIDAQLGSLHLAAAGRYSWSGQVAGRFDLTASDLAAVSQSFGLTDVPIAGAGRLTGTIQGEARSPIARAELTADGLAVNDTAIGTLDATLGLADRRLAVDASAPRLAIQLNGELDTGEPLAYELVANLDRTSIPALVPESLRAQVPVRDGTLSATVTAHGELRQPLQATAETVVHALELDLSGTPIALEAPATISFGPEVVSTTGIPLRLGQQSQVRLQGALGRERTLDGLELSVNAALEDLVALSTPFLTDLQIDAAGSIAADLRVGGTLLAPQPVGTITLSGGVLHYSDHERDWPPLTDLSLRGRIDQSRIVLESLAAAWQGAMLTAEGSLPLRLIVPAPPPGAATGGEAAWGSAWLASLPDEPRAATLRATLNGIGSNVLAPFVSASQLERVEGEVVAVVSAEADAFELDRTRATVVIEQGSLTLAGVPFVQSVPTRLALETGQLRIEDFRWNAEGNEITLSGGVSVADPDPTMDFAFGGDIDLRVLSVLAPGVAAGGLAHSNLTMTGLYSAPRIAGDIEVVGGELRIEAPPIAASDVDGVISVASDWMATISLEGTINGGAATLAGSVGLEDVANPSGSATLTARNVTLDFPDGFQTESNADLMLTLGEAESTVTGRIDVLSGIYREPIIVSRGLLTGFGRRELTTATTESTFLTSLRLDVAIATVEDILVDNNYARLNAAANLRIQGTADRPVPLGRVDVVPDGEIYLAGSTYRIQNLVVALTDPFVTTPEVTFLAETRMGNVPIEVSLQCSADRPCEREVRSQAAGVTNEEAERLLFGVSSDPSVAGAQLASLLSGEVFGIVGRRVGLDTLRLEQSAANRADLFDDPTLVAGDVNPASRLTFGKRLGENVELAYSQDLSDDAFTTSTTYFAPHSMSFRALLLDDQSRSYEFRHEPLGGRSRTRSTRTGQQPTIAAVRFGGTPGFPERELRARLRLTEGDRFDFARWQQDRERLSELYHSRGFYEARIRARRLNDGSGQAVQQGATGDAVVLEYTIQQGPATRLDVAGFELPEDIRDRVVDRWTSAVFDGFLERDAQLIVRQHLYLEGRLQATVAATADTEATAGVKTLKLEIDPGPVLTVDLQLVGNELVPSERLLEAAAASGTFSAWLDRAAFEAAIERVYLEEGLLSAEVDVQEPVVLDGVSVVRTVIREGEPWRVGQVTLGGTDELEGGGTPQSFGLPAGSRYEPRVVDERVADLERRFREAGFLSARVLSEIVLDHEKQRADIHVLAQSGPRSILSAVAVEGADADSSPIARSMAWTVGAPVTTSMLSDTRRRMYETGVFRSVEIDLEPVGASPGVASELDGTDRPVVARVQVAERPRYRFRYGLAFRDDVVGTDLRERRLGVAADLENRNLFGSGATAGLSARVRRDQQVGRLYLGTSRFFGLPLRSNVFVSRSREDIGSDPAFPITSDVTEFSAEQTFRLGRLLDFRYGYAFGQNRTTIESQDVEVSVKAARLTATGLVDHRDDPFDSTRGWFTSANMELSRPGLGSDISFIKMFLQYLQFVPIRERVVFASATRLGTARTFNDEALIPSERFFSGGATSLRGYHEDDLGPRSLFGDAEGGRALFIVNTEVRFPVYRWLRSVAFVDFGNVYETLSDLTSTALQVGVGGGARFDTPVGVLRLDIGVPINPREFDPKWQVHFGLGHVF